MNDLSRNNNAAGGDKALNVLKDNTVIRLYLVCYINAALVKNEFHDPFKLSNMVRVEDPINEKVTGLGAAFQLFCQCHFCNYNSVMNFMVIKFFSNWVFFHEHSGFTWQQGMGAAISLALLYHSHPLYRH